MEWMSHNHWLTGNLAVYNVRYSAPLYCNRTTTKAMYFECG